MSPLVSARNLSLYLLSLVSLASAAIAWGEATPLRLLVHAASLAGALLLGLALADVFSGVGSASMRKRARYGVMVGFLLAGLLAVAASLASARLAAGAVVAYGLVQPLALVLAEVLGLQAAALLGALVLTVLAVLGGGLPAAVAALAYLTLLPFFFAYDHASRRLHARPPSSPVHLFGPVTRDAATTVAPVVLLLAAFFALAPAPTPDSRTADGWTPPGKITADEQTRRSYQWLIFLGLAGGGLVFGLGRLLKGEGAAPLIEPVETQVESEELLEPALLDDARYGSGQGRVIRAYVRFLDRARSSGLNLGGHLTPREIEAVVRPSPQALPPLTVLFMNARYGPDEPSAEEVGAAERASREAVAGLATRRRRRGRVRIA